MLEKEQLIEPIKVINHSEGDILIVNRNSFVEEKGTEGPTIGNSVGKYGAIVNLKKRKI